MTRVLFATGDKNIPPATPPADAEGSAPTPSRERTAELLEELAHVVKDAEMLKVRIGDAERRVLANTLRDPNDKKKKPA